MNETGTPVLMTWASRIAGASPSRMNVALPNVRVDDLEWLDDAGKQQLRDWGTTPPPVPGNPPAWVTDESAWERAKDAVKKKWTDYDEPWAVVAHVYQNMTGG